MPKRTLEHHAWLIKELKDPVVASNYLNEALEDSPQMFLKALRNVGEAWRISIVAKEAGVRRESLYRTLSKYGNPRLNTLHAVLRVLGLEIKVQPEAADYASSNVPEAPVTRSYRHGPSRTTKVGMPAPFYQNQNVAAEVWTSIPSAPRNPKGPESLVVTSMTPAFVGWKAEESPVQPPSFLLDVNQGLLENSALLVASEYAKQRSAPPATISI